MAQILVTVVNRMGSFSGSIMLEANSSKEDAVKTVREIIGSINTLNSLAIEDIDGGATVFGSQILRESVITLRSSE